MKWSIRGDRQPTTVGDGSSSGAHRGRERGIGEFDRVKHSRRHRNIDGARVYVYAVSRRVGHCVMKTRASAGARTGDGSLFRYPTRASRSEMLSGVRRAPLGGPRPSPPVTRKSFTMTL